MPCDVIFGQRLLSKKGQAEIKQMKGWDVPSKNNVLDSQEGQGGAKDPNTTNKLVSQWTRLMKRKRCQRRRGLNCMEQRSQTCSQQRSTTGVLYSTAWFESSSNWWAKDCHLPPVATSTRMMSSAYHRLTVSKQTYFESFALGDACECVGTQRGAFADRNVLWSDCDELDGGQSNQH